MILIGREPCNGAFILENISQTQLFSFAKLRFSKFWSRAEDNERIDV